MDTSESSDSRTKKRTFDQFSKDPELYSYWRSSSAWRVRIALHIKNIEYTYHAVNLLEGAQKSAEYAKLNPMKVVPALTIDGQTLVQSKAIIEYLEETRPDHPLLPKDTVQRARVRAVVDMIGSDIQPVQNLRVLKMVVQDIPAGDVAEAKKNAWAKFWINEGFQAVEAELKQFAGKYSVGDELSMADCFLVPQAYNARRFGVDMTQFPTIARVVDALSALQPFKDADPEVQPDRPAPK